MNKHIINTLICGYVLLPLTSSALLIITPNPFTVGNTVTTTGTPFDIGAGGGGLMVDTSGQKGCTILLSNMTASVSSFSANCWGVNVPASPFQLQLEWFPRVWEAAGGLRGVAIPTTKPPSQNSTSITISINNLPSGVPGEGWTGGYREYNDINGGGIAPPPKPTCSLSGTSTIEHTPLHGGGIADEETINHSVSCTRATDITLSINPNHITMGEGGEIESVLTIDGKPSILLKAVGPKGTNFLIKSTVHFPVETSAGSYSGSSVLKVTLQ
ncbi:Uncharacterised protein [Serratia proteamaculans]|nr:Uncharacterised protein [Serratia proteamaculans]